MEGHDRTERLQGDRYQKNIESKVSIQGENIERKVSIPKEKKSHHIFYLPIIGSFYHPETPI